MNQYLLNAIDMYTAYGLIVENGSDDFLRMPERKEPYSYDWPEFDGKEYDLTEAPKFKDKEIELQGHIVANSEADFWTKYNALMTAFNVAGTLPITCVELNKTVNVFYRNMTTAKRLTRIKNTNLIGVAVTIKLQEVLFL